MSERPRDEAVLVYAICQGAYSDFEISKIFATREIAESYLGGADRQDVSDYYIKEYPFFDKPFEERTIVWHVGSSIGITAPLPYGEGSTFTHSSIHDFETGHGYVPCAYTTTDSPGRRHLSAVGTDRDLCEKTIAEAVAAELKRRQW